MYELIHYGWHLLRQTIDKARQTPLAWRGVGGGLLLLFLLSSCARMGNPDGGWYDETPPHVVGASPADKAVNVKEQKVRIVFDEFIKIENASEKVVVSPPQIEMPEIRATGKRIEVELKDSLKPNTTYTIDFSDAITDNNENNPLGNYTYSFSTGADIDTMEVSGYVLNAEDLEPMKGVLVGLYRLDGEGMEDEKRKDDGSKEEGMKDEKRKDGVDLPDSTFRTKPLERVSRTDSRGRFVVKGVANGRYRIFALQDADATYTFNQKSEAVAFNHDVITPSCFPDVRQDTIWRDSLHISSIDRVGYTHFMPDNIVLRAFTEPQTDRFLIKTERKEADHFTFYFSSGHEQLPVIKGINFDETDAFIVDQAWRPERATGSDQADTITYWLRDTTLINQDTLRMEVTFLMTDSTGVLTEHTESYDLLAKTPYAKRLKQQQKAFEDWQKKQEKRRKRGEPYDSIMPQEPLKLRLNMASQLDPDKNINIDTPTPLAVIDTSLIHLYTKIDTLWYEARYVIDTLSTLSYRLRGEWRPGQEYSFEADSAAFVDIYGFASNAIKQGFGVKNNDAYATLLMQISDRAGQPIVAQLLNNGDKVVKQMSTKNGNVEFFYLNPGTYYLRIFVDNNDNGLWDTGNYDEDRQPEAVFYYHEPIECKAKWDYNLTWNTEERPLFEQKSEKLKKQKADKKRTITNKNEQRAKQLGIQHVKNTSQTSNKTNP